MSKRKFAAVGTGGRIPMFIDPIVGKYRNDCELVGLCDTSATRRSYHQQRLVRDYGIAPVPTYADFDQMLRETRPDTVIVCTPDFLHHDYIVKSLEYGADVISEKPLTTDADKARLIFAAVERTGRRLRTIFNMRWSPGVGKVRELIAQGSIGRVRHIDFEYMLNTSHGADYFRRWHSRKECSGGLLVHKSTHHFDLINWWLDGIPALVFGLGGLVFYGKKNAMSRGNDAWTRYDRYTGVPASKGDPFRLDVDSDPAMRGLYYNAEAETGYIRDQNVFREDIDIEDSMSLLIKYRRGEMVTYSLNAYCPAEGFRASISGDAGRIEYVENHSSHIITGDPEIKAEREAYSTRLQVQKLFSEPVVVEVPAAEGGHGGGDPLIQEQMFSACPPFDPLNRSAGHEQGAASLLIGAAGNLSIATGRPVVINDLLPLKPTADCLSELI
jgi:predicted dehydrogenase